MHGFNPFGRWPAGLTIIVFTIEFVLRFMRTRLNLSLRGSSAHPELVEGRGNLDEAEHTSTNRRCYGDEIANPRIEYGVAMTKRVHMSILRFLTHDAGSHTILPAFRIAG